MSDEKYRLHRGDKVRYHGSNKSEYQKKTGEIVDILGKGDFVVVGWDTGGMGTVSSDDVFLRDEIPAMKEMNAGGVIGFQVPASIKKRKSKVDELLKRTSDINEGHMLAFLGSLDESGGEKVGAALDGERYDEVADQVRQHAVRELVKQKVKEVVRKKAGGGGYVLYSPNQGKKKHPKSVGNFPTKTAAKKAELARYPPKDPLKLQRLRKEVDRLLKNPDKKADKEKTAQKQKGTDDSAPKTAKPKSKKESAAVLPDGSGFATGTVQSEMALRRLDFMHRQVISKVIKESLFREEVGGSEWDEFIAKLSKQALGTDKKFAKLQANIDKKTESVLDGAFNSIRKSVNKEIKMKSFGVKKDPQLGKTYLAFSATMDNVEVGPFYVYAENGVPKIELSDNAKVALTKVDPANVKPFRAELITVQERILDSEESLVDAIVSRDKYLAKVEMEVDSFVAGLTPLQISMLKQLLVRKYRKIS